MSTTQEEVQQNKSTESVSKPATNVETAEDSEKLLVDATRKMFTNVAEYLEGELQGMNTKEALL